MRAKPNLTVTLFAPEPPELPKLAWLQEIGNISGIDHVDLKVIGGPDVHINAIARGLQERRDVMLWSGHGVPGGLLLPGKRLIRSRWLATQVQCGIPRLLVLAACGSLARDPQMRSMSAEIAKAGVNVVGFPLAAEDLAAATYNVELIRALATGASVGTATDVALESIACDYPQVASGVFLMAGLTNGYRDFITRLESVEQRIDGVDAHLDAVDSGQQQLITRVDLLLEHLKIAAPRGGAVTG